MRASGNAPTIARRRSSPDKQSTRRNSKPQPVQTSPVKHQRTDSGPFVGSPLAADQGINTIRTAIRIRPRTSSSSGDWLRCRQTVGTSSVVEIVDQKPAAESKLYGADHVFAEPSTQEAVFEAIGVAAIDSVLAGYNNSVITYGQAGSGKTYTMLGDVALESWHRGLIVRMLEDLFAKLPEQFECVISFVEICNEKIYDLLDATAAEAKPIREDTALNEVFVQDLVQVPVASAVEAVEWLQRGAKARTVAATAMHRESSRAHAVFSVKIRHHIGDQLTRRAVLHCVDLAGSEKHNPMNKCVKEASHINKSLSCLVGVIKALADASVVGKRHIPYRDSKLTFLLREALGGGNAKTTLIGTVSADDKYMSETLSTLQFVEKATHVTTTKAKPNEEATDKLILSLQTQVAQLKEALDATTRRQKEVSMEVPKEVSMEVEPVTLTWQSMFPPLATSVLLVAAGFCLGRYLRRR